MYLLLLTIFCTRLKCLRFLLNFDVPTASVVTNTDVVENLSQEKTTD